MLQNCDVIAIPLIYGQFAAIWKPVSGRIVCKPYISINSNLSSYKNWKQNWKTTNTALTLALWVKVLFWPKNYIFFNGDISKIKRALVLKDIFSETTYCVYLRAKFQVSSIILTSFRQGGKITPTSPHLKTNP